MGDKFQVIAEFIKTRNYKLLEERLHDDFLMIREEGLVTKDEFVSYLSGDLEGDNAIILLDYKCLLARSLRCTRYRPKDYFYKL